MQSDRTSETMKRYEGNREEGVVTVTVNGLLLNPRHDLRNHSPNGFEWGYGGSGPAQLALAILADYFGKDEPALAVYQSFKWAVVANLPKHAWSITNRQIDQALKEIRTQGAGGAV